MSACFYLGGVSVSLAENAKKYYWDMEMNCAEGILLGGSDTYGLNLTTQDAVLFSGFGGGMGCGKICGCCAASIGVLGKLFGDREDFRDICAAFTAEFESGMGCDSINCENIAAKYKTEEKRCTDAVVLAAEILEKFIYKYNK